MHHQAIGDGWHLADGQHRLAAGGAAGKIAYHHKIPARLIKVDPSKVEAVSSGGGQRSAIVIPRIAHWGGAAHAQDEGDIGPLRHRQILQLREDNWWSENG